MEGGNFLIRYLFFPKFIKSYFLLRGSHKENIENITRNLNDLLLTTLQRVQQKTFWTGFFLPIFPRTEFIQKGLFEILRQWTAKICPKLTQAAQCYTGFLISFFNCLQSLHCPRLSFINS